ncbi:heat shock 70 kDa protein 12A-like [Saccostrea echinata]|uniref:heat shock 70 kDa protein 12A-like n=1 Tax=Saccostrea echinata TaxID=191078 RepID=UPI002A83F755|nr:heat shock 70 kDa protein 12A-like [Saccostrea echinata]
MNEFDISAAIDFGTTYSGYAYCSKNDFKQQFPPIKTSAWKSGTGTSDKFMKTPTTVLFDKDKTFHSFGFEAEKKYLNLVLRDKHESWYFFRNFKMRLHQREVDKGKDRLSLDSILEDEMGKSIKAMDVFTSSIRYLKDHLLGVLVEQGMKDKDEAMQKIQWVVTVPAIWTDPAKEFMKEAAIRAGIDENKLLLALEPEAASLCCWSMHNQSPDGRKIITPGTSYTVLDMGGGTVDIVTHKVEENRALAEIHPPVGGDWGGTQVNSSFLNLLIKLVGAPIITKFKNEKFFDYLEMMSEFEIKKQFISFENDEEVVLKVPESLVRMFEDESDEKLMDVIQQSTMDGDLEWTSGRLIVQPERFKSLFSVSIDNITSKLKEMFKENGSRDVSTLLLVGGFSESPVLKKAIRDTFRDKRIVIPEHPSMAILKGAVIYGHAPLTVQTRICKYTYGFMAVKPIQTSERNVPFDRTIQDGRLEAGFFDKLVEVGQAVDVGRHQVTKTYNKVSPYQASMILMMYISTAKNPKSVTDDTCSLLGDLTISLPSDPQAEVIVYTTFSDTHLMVKAEEKRTHQKVTAKFHFLR